MIHGLDAAREALSEGRPALVWEERVVDTLTPVGAALRLISPKRGDFLLESVEGGAVRGRYSLLGLDPDLVFIAQGDTARVNRSWQHDRDRFDESESGPLDTLKALVAESRIAVPDGLPPALAFLVGYFAYETIALVENLPRAPNPGLNLPDMVFVRPTVLCVFDNLSDTMVCISPIWPGATDAETLLGRAAERIANVLETMGQGEPASPSPDLPEAVEFSAHTTPERYAEMVERAREYIRAGDIFQVVLSQRFSAPFPLPPLTLYRALRRVNPSPFLFFLDLPDFAVVGSSPEILVRVRDGEVTIRPIAGTRPRGATTAEDLAKEAELLADPKERAEHLMLLDLGRNDVGRVARADSVRVTDSFTVERYSHVMHIVSNVVGALADDRDAVEALFAGFPAGTVSGAPKIRACEIIAELEADRRGPYAGGVGYFAPDGGLDSCIVLRTAVVKDEVMHVQAGAGIVADSDAAYEQAECEAKAGALLSAAREAVRLARAQDIRR